MGKITLEQIDLIMQRTHVSYSDAKEALEAADGDILEAILLIEKRGNAKTNAKHMDTASASEKVTSFIDNLNNTTFLMYKNERTFVDVPLSIALIFVILSFYFSLLGLIIVLCCGVKISIKGENEIARKINSTFDEFNKK